MQDSTRIAKRFAKLRQVKILASGVYLVAVKHIHGGFFVKNGAAATCKPKIHP